MAESAPKNYNTRFDEAARYLAKQAPVSLLTWLLRRERVKFIQWLDTRNIPFPSDKARINDTVAWLEDPDAVKPPWAVALEFQLDPDSLMFGRGLIYCGSIWLDRKPNELPGDRYDIGMIVANLRGRGHAFGDMPWPEVGLHLKFQPVEINLEELDAEVILEGIASGAVPMIVLPFIPLMKKGSEAGVFERWIAIASPEQDLHRRGDYGGLALVFAEAAKCLQPWKLALKGWNMIESQVVLEWQKQARDEGLE